MEELHAIVKPCTYVTNVAYRDTVVKSFHSTWVPQRNSVM